MTERDPDPLFDALRARLGAHERPAAPAIWAALAGQLAAHRRRQRRRRAAWLLGSLVVVIGFALWPLLVVSPVAELPASSSLSSLSSSSSSLSSLSSSSGGAALPSSLSGAAALPSSSGGAALPSSLSGAAALPSSSGSATFPSSLSSGTAALPSSGSTGLPVLLPSSVAAGPAGHSENTAPFSGDPLAPVVSAPDTSGAPAAGVAGRVGQRVDTAASPAALRRRSNDRPLLEVLSPRLIRLKPDSLPPTPYPALALRADTTRPEPAPPGRWRFGVVAGLAFTSRTLATPGAGPLARAERAGLAGAGALRVAYALGPRWHLRTGLGYAAYRTTVRAQLVHTGGQLAYVRQTIIGPGGAPIQVLSWQWVANDSVRLGQSAVRAVVAARYLTVPLLAEWHPRAPAPRWRPVLAGGLVPHLLLSARAPRLNAACNCEPDPAPMRRFALGISAEAGFDYALTPDLWLTLRPAASYLLTDAAAPARATRHPWRAGLTVGLEWAPPPRAARR